MTAGGFGALRRDRVRNELRRVEADVEAWLGRWKEGGPQTSQIARCGEVLRGMLEHLRTREADLPADERGLATARALEWDLSIVEGLSRLLAERFEQREQREQPALAATLRAADELIWSCVQYARPLVPELPLPLPLAYIEPAFSPSATPRQKPPPALPARDRLLGEMLRVLPVPLIGLPAGIVEEPWWLVLIAHEVGHHVQYDADPEAVKRTGVALREATGDPAWEAWRQEVFADLFAVLALGPVAIEATAELEWDLPEAMATAKTMYPPAIVRLAIMAEGARVAGHAGAPFGADSWADTLAQVSEARREVVAGQLSCVAAVVAAVLDVRVGACSLRKLVGKPPATGAPLSPDPTATKLRRRLRGENVGFKGDRELPRSAVREAFIAYRDLAAELDLERRATAQRGLRERAVALLREVGDPEAKRARPRAVTRGGDDTAATAATDVADATATAAIVDRMLDVLRGGDPE
jgi:hypothetical protein